jgi:hypothetical protein
MKTVRETNFTIYASTVCLIALNVYLMFKYQREIYQV